MINTTWNYPAISVIAVPLLLMIGCAASSPYKHLEFTQDNVSAVHSGMTISEVEVLFGVPDTTYNMKFGKNSGAEWEGLVYKYYGPRDTLYVFAKRRLANTFVFYTAIKPPTLNNWDIEFTSQRSRK